jgi:hypothetical protein
MSDDPVKLLRARHDAGGLVVHAHTATPSWHGERLNVGYAIDVLHPLAIGNGVPVRFREDDPHYSLRVGSVVIGASGVLHEGGRPRGVEDG